MPISESEKHHIDKLVPIKKRRFLLRSTSPPPKVPSPVNKENLKLSKSHDVPIQASVAFPLTCKSELAAMTIEKEDVQGNSPKKVNENLRHIEDFSGISILAAAACSSSLGREFGYAEDGSGVEEPSLHEGPAEVTNCEAQSLSNALAMEECVNTSGIFVGGTSSCVTTTLAGEYTPTSTFDCPSGRVGNIEKNIKDPFHEDVTPTVSSDVSSMKNEDVVGSLNLQSQDCRLLWDLNVEMDAWEEPFDCQNVRTPEHSFKDSENAVRCVGGMSAKDHDLLNEPKSFMHEVEKKLNYEPTESLHQISEGNEWNQVDRFNHKNQTLNMCNISLSSGCKNVPSSMGDGNISVQPLLFKCLNGTSPVLKPFGIEKHVDNEPTGESINFDVTAPHFKDQRNLPAPPVPDRNCAAVSNKTSVSVINTQVGLAVQPTLDIERELTLEARMSDKPFVDRMQNLKNDENCAKVFTSSQVKSDATPEKGQKENDHPRRSSCLREFNFKEVKMASAEHLEEKFISDAVDPCSKHKTEDACKLQDDNESQYEDGELREPTELVLEEYQAINEKTEQIDCGFDKSRCDATSGDRPDSDHGQVMRVSHSSGIADIVTSAEGAANELGAESHRSVSDDNDQPKDEIPFKFVHSGDEKMKGPASSEPSLPNAVRVREDGVVKSRICSLATRSADSEATDTRNGSRLYGRGLPSQIEGPVVRDGPFRVDRAVTSSKPDDGIDTRWDRGFSYVKSSERVRYPMQRQPRNHQINSWDGYSDVRRGIKCNYSPTNRPQVKPDDGVDSVQKEDTDDTINTASYLSHGPTNHDSFQPNPRSGRGRFIRYGRQMDQGAGRGRFHRASDDSFQSIKYRRPLSQRDRSYSPSERRGYQFAQQSCSKSPSRSRTRSPDPRFSPRGRRSTAGGCGGTYLRPTSRSPNFRPEVKIMRITPFQRDHESPPSSRWVNTRKEDPGHFTYKKRPFQDKSPNRVHMRGDRTDHFDPPRNPKPYYRQNTARFSEMDGDNRPHRPEENFENRRRQFGPINNPRRIYEDGPAKTDDAEFHGRGNNNISRDIDSRNGENPRRFRRDGSNFVYERDGRFTGMDSLRNFKAGEPYRSSINPGRFSERDGAGRGQRYEERRRQYNYFPRRHEMEGRLSHDHVNDNPPALPQNGQEAENNGEISTVLENKNGENGVQDPAEK